MGATLARRLLSEGLTVTVWNRNPAAAAPLVSAGAGAVADLADIWRTTGTAMTFLADDEAVLQVYLSGGGLVESAPARPLLIEMIPFLQLLRHVSPPPPWTTTCATCAAP